MTSANTPSAHQSAPVNKPSPPQMAPGLFLAQGRYQISEILNKGRWSLTLRALCTPINQPVILKMPRRFGKYTPQHQAWMQQIWKRMAYFQHPNLQQTLDFFQESGLPVLVMEEIRGTSLARTIEGQPMSETEALGIIRQVGNLLQTLHERGVFHGDVKPQNLISHSRSGAIVLVDWGLLPDVVVMPETSYYQAPESFLGVTHTVGLRIGLEIYALASTLYTLVTGHVPVAAARRSEIPLPPPRQLQPDLSQQIEQVILQGMELNATLRPPNLSAYLAMLPSDFAMLDFSSHGVSLQGFPLKGVTLSNFSTGDQGSSIEKDLKSSAPILSAQTPSAQVPSRQKNRLTPPCQKHKIVNSRRRLFPIPLKFLATTGFVSALVGVSLGLVFRFNHSDSLQAPGFLQQEQPFPEQAWPGTDFPEVPEEAPVPEKTWRDPLSTQADLFEARRNARGSTDSELWDAEIADAYPDSEVENDFLKILEQELLESQRDGSGMREFGIQNSEV